MSSANKLFPFLTAVLIATNLSPALGCVSNDWDI